MGSMTSTLLQDIKRVMDNVYDPVENLIRVDAEIIATSGTTFIMNCRVWDASISAYVPQASSTAAGSFADNRVYDGAIWRNSIGLSTGETYVVPKIWNPATSAYVTPQVSTAVGSFADGRVYDGAIWRNVLGLSTGETISVPKGRETSGNTLVEIRTTTDGHVKVTADTPVPVVLTALSTVSISQTAEGTTNAVAVKIWNAATSAYVSQAASTALGTFADNRVYDGAIWRNQTGTSSGDTYVVDRYPIVIQKTTQTAATNVALTTSWQTLTMFTAAHTYTQGTMYIAYTKGDETVAQIKIGKSFDQVTFYDTSTTDISSGVCTLNTFIINLTASVTGQTYEFPFCTEGIQYSVRGTGDTANGTISITTTFGH